MIVGFALQPQSSLYDHHTHKKTHKIRSVVWVFQLTTIRDEAKYDLPWKFRAPLCHKLRTTCIQLNILPTRMNIGILIQI